MAQASLTFSSGHAHVNPGSQVTLTAIVGYDGPVPEDFLISLHGIEPAWVTLRTPVLQVAPGERATVTLVVSPPPNAPPAEATLALRLTSQNTGIPPVEATARLTIGAPSTPAATPSPSEAVTREMHTSRWRSLAQRRQILLASAAVLLVTLITGLIIVLPFGSEPKQAAAAMLCAGPATRVASLLSDDRTTAILVSEPDFTDMRVLRTEPGDQLPGLFDSLLALSPDGSRLAYVTAANPMMDEAHLWAIDVANPANAVELAYIPKGFWPVRPAWSPDNRAVAFIRLNEAMAARNQALLEIWVAEAGSQPRKVGSVADLTPETFYGSPEIPLCWAQDNRTLIFASLAKSTDGQAQQTQVDVETGDAQTVPRPRATPEGAAGAADARGGLGSAPQASGTGCGVPIYSQNDPAWRYLIMRAAGDSIGGFGCALTSTAMLFNYYGASLTPPQLNECLGDYADPLYWSQATNCGGGIVTDGNRFDFSWETLDQVLAGGHPAIVGMVRGQTGMHFVVVTAGGGGNGANYAVTDPWDGTTHKTLQYFFNAGYNPRWVVTYNGPGRNCTRVVTAGGTAGGGSATGGQPQPPPPPQVDGVIDGGIYKDPVTIDIRDVAGVEHTAVIGNLAIDALAGESGTAAGTPTGGATPGATPEAGSATPQPPGSTGPHAGGPVRIVDVPVTLREITPGMVIADEGVYHIFIVSRPAGFPVQITRLKFTIDRSAPLVNLATSGETSQAGLAPVPGRATSDAVAALASDVALQPGDPEFRGEALFQIQADDLLSGVATIEYRLDDGEWQEYSNDVSFGHTLVVDEIGDHILAFRAADLAGNVSPEGSYAFTVVAGEPATPTPSAEAMATATPAATATATTTTTSPTAQATPTPTATATATATATPTDVARAPAITLDPATLDFGRQPIGTAATKTVTVTSSGTAALEIASVSITGNTGEYAIASDGCSRRSLQPKQTCTIDVTYTANLTTPPAVAPRLQIMDNAKDSPHSVTLSGLGVGKPAIAVDPTTVDFGEQPLNTVTTRTITVTSSGTLPLVISGATITGDTGEYAIAGDRCSRRTLKPGETCEIAVTRRATNTTPSGVSTQLEITHNAEGSPAIVPLKGTTPAPAVPGIAVDPTSLDFGQVGSDESKELTVTVTSVGSAPLAIRGSDILDDKYGEFAVEHDSCADRQLAPGESCTIVVTFTPDYDVSVSGARTGRLGIYSNAARNPVTVLLTGDIYPQVLERRQSGPRDLL